MVAKRVIAMAVMLVFLKAALKAVPTAVSMVAWTVVTLVMR